MQLKDSKSGYGLISIANHWVIAILIIAMIALGLYVEDMPRSPEKRFLVGLHQSFGILALALGLFRVHWRLRSGMPEPAVAIPRWQEVASTWTHRLMLAFVIVMPISGYLWEAGEGHAPSLFGLFSLPALPKSKLIEEIGHVVHGLGGKLLQILILVHVLAALKHHLFDKDATLRRMLRPI